MASLRVPDWHTRLLAAVLKAPDGVPPPESPPSRVSLTPWFSTIPPNDRKSGRAWTFASLGDPLNKKSIVFLLIPSGPPASVIDQAMIVGLDEAGDAVDRGGTESELKRDAGYRGQRPAKHSREVPEQHAERDTNDSESRQRVQAADARRQESAGGA